MVWRTMALAAAVALSFAASAQSQFWNEDFEADGAGSVYTLSTTDGAHARLPDHRSRGGHAPTHVSGATDAVSSLVHQPRGWRTQWVRTSSHHF